MPEDRTVFGGDLVYNDMPPNLKFGNPATWVKALDSLIASQAETIVPGHGSLCGRARLGELRSILTTAIDAVDRLRRAEACDVTSLASRLGLSTGSANRLWEMAQTDEEWPAWPYGRGS